MPEHTVILHKKSGGSTLTGPDGETYTWAKDGEGVECPYDWAMELKAIPDGGFYIDGDPQAATRFDGRPVSVQTAAQAGLDGSQEGGEPVTGTATLHTAGEDEDDSAEVTEPAPKGEHHITEPAPPPMHPASPVTPRVQAGTRPRPGGKK